ncbi:hypothetical protein [Nonomuraea sp. NPDC005501]|uniref:hypothetical protein n=1 Tax=Nonomuraea sp. NPDC005501 TaxID=3156884 RepID=UPI0033B38C3C
MVITGGAGAAAGEDVHRPAAQRRDQRVQADLLTADAAVVAQAYLLTAADLRQLI